MRTVQPVRTQEQLSQVQSCAQVALAVPLRYAQAGSSLAHAALAGARDFEILRHYPRSDVVDRRAGTRFYYHAHRLDEPEHGHFHLFADGKAPGEHLHLVALALDVRGQPLRWFTTNRWVTAGRWAPAPEVWRHLKSFDIRCGGRLAPVARWLTAMVVLFADDLQNLLQARDAVLAPHLSAAACADRVFEDRELEVLSECPALLAPRVMQLAC